MKHKHNESASLERRIPKLMVRPTVETSTVGNSVRKVPKLLCTPTPKVQTAFTNEVEGQCPVCLKPMGTSVANGIDVYVCMDHRVTMPLKNENGA